MNAASSQRRGLAQWAGMGAILFVILFVVGGIFAFGAGQPDTNSPPAKVIAYYGDSEHRDKIALGWLLILLGVFFFLWFFAALRQCLSRIDGEGFLTTLVTAGGTIYATAVLAGASLDTAIRTMSDDTFRHQVYPGIIHAGNDAGYVIFSAGGIGMGALIIAASTIARRAGVIPGWAGWVGVVIGITALVSIFFLPHFLIALWLIVAGIGLFRSKPVAAAPPAAT